MSDSGLTKEATDRWVTVNGIKLHYNEAGAGPGADLHPRRRARRERLG